MPSVSEERTPELAAAIAWNSAILPHTEIGEAATASLLFLFLKVLEGSARGTSFKKSPSYLILILLYISLPIP